MLSWVDHEKKIYSLWNLLYIVTTVFIIQTDCALLLLIPDFLYFSHFAFYNDDLKIVNMTETEVISEL